MKTLLLALNVAVGFCIFAPVARADLIGDQNWADEVEDFSSAIQNYAHVFMDDSTTWWLTGPPDADETRDYVGGWCSNAPSEYIIMRWIAPLHDRPGDDLMIRMYSGPAASANVLASADGLTYVSIGTLGGGTPENFRSETFDFGGVLGDKIAYIKVERVANGAQTGMYFDSFGGTVLSSMIPGDANDDKIVDQFDARALAAHWGKDNATWEMGDFDGDDMVGPADASILAANWGYGSRETSSSVPEPSTSYVFTLCLLLVARRRSPQAVDGSRHS